jgi:DNA replication protein DnaC
MNGASDSPDAPRRLLDAAALKPGESSEDWFRRNIGEMPPPVDGTDEPADAPEQEQRRAALSALETTIPASYRWARFSAPELRQRVPAAALAWAEEAWRHDRVCLMGASRAGKTSIAVAMLRCWVSHANRPAAFVHAYRLGVARILHPAGHGEPELVECAMRTPLVLLDDLGGERDHAHSALPDLLVERHAENRPTWITTGMTREQLVKRYGQGIVARVFERATVIRVGVEARAEALTKKK